MSWGLKIFLGYILNIKGVTSVHMRIVIRTQYLTFRVKRTWGYWRSYQYGIPKLWSKITNELTNK